jgi:bifunctional non-homologous end joining protein LigD
MPMAEKKKRAAKDAPPSAMAFVTPMAAENVQVLPRGKDWLYELKIDGYRALLMKEGDRIEIRSRRDNLLTRSYPGVVSAARRLKSVQVMLDGEVVAIDASGRPSFQALQHRGSHRGYEIVFYVFDVLHLEGHDLKSLPLIKRREVLPELLHNTGLRLSAELPGTPEEIVEAVRAMGLEGVIAKNKRSIYQPGERSTDWQKLKLQHQQEFVIGGYRPDGQSVDALIVGYYDDQGLRFAGKVRAGLIPHVRRELVRTLQPFHAPLCPFVDLPSEKTSRWGGGVSRDDMKQIQWLKPEAVAQIAFVEWTADGRLRASEYLGLRSDKTPREVQRES